MKSISKIGIACLFLFCTWFFNQVAARADQNDILNQCQDDFRMAMFDPVMGCGTMSGYDQCVCEVNADCAFQKCVNPQPGGKEVCQTTSGGSIDYAVYGCTDGGGGTHGMLLN